MIPAQRRSTGSEKNRKKMQGHCPARWVACVCVSMETKNTFTFTFPLNPSTITDAMWAKRLQSRKEIRDGDLFKHLPAGVRERIASDQPTPLDLQNLQWVADRLSVHPVKRLQAELEFWFSTPTKDSYEFEEEREYDLLQKAWVKKALDLLDAGDVQGAFQVVYDHDRDQFPAPDGLNLSKEMWADVEIKASRSA